MKHGHRGGSGRHFPPHGGVSEHPGSGRHGHHRAGRSGRFFDYGELRLLILAMLAERPRHGYELIKDIEERLGGAYSPSPGVIYPTLAWLDDMGYAAIEAEEGGRKRYRATAEGEAFLTANRAAVEGLIARISTPAPGMTDLVPAPVVRAMENLKLAMRLRLKRGPIDPAAAERIAATLDAAAQTVERSG
ncbi:PadR family transcriptional regulator [Stigmatella aurantiaca]|nr:PadR family transcriptional regulator [Stigmatella aurantiaca]ADO75178.1 Transcriptional regulator, PadR family [Stigmatella aurantiaca DW4/3-1]